MSRNQFSRIMKCKRFDDKSTRIMLKSKDVSCLARDMWDRFISNSQSCYYPDQVLTVDEQLLPTKTRSQNIQYIPNKPDKFRIKFWFLVDLETKYTVNAFPYLEANSDKTKLNYVYWYNEKE